MSHSKHIFFGFLLLVSLGVFGWLYVQSESQPLTVTQSTDHRPDAQGINVTVKQFNTDGQLSSRMQTSRMTHYAENDTTYFVKPHLVVYRPPQAPWTIQSLQGRAENGDEKITLWQQVKIQQPASKQKVATTITTERISYFPNKKFVTTDKPITMRQPGLEVKSVGMNAYVDQGRVDLLSKAQARYVDPEAQS